MSAPGDGRRERLAGALAGRGVGVMMVTAAANVRYLTGYVGSNGIALVGPSGSVLLTDSRYAVSAREQVTGAEVVIGGRDLLGDVPVTPTRGLVEDMRVVKDAGEVAAMREAAAVVDRALGTVLSAGIVGRTEGRVAFALLEAMLDEGAEGPSFATIVASGPRGARPHHVPGSEVVPPGTLVVIDLGAVVGGYCSDMTRTVATGDLPPRLAEIHAVCLAAEQAALAAARPGMSASELDGVARAIIAEAGYGEHFGHGLGHGVGLDIHERPGVRPGASEVLRAGMAVTIEPGVYLEGEGGVRIEDLVVLGDGGNEVLSTSPTEMTRVD